MTSNSRLTQNAEYVCAKCGVGLSRDWAGYTHKPVVGLTASEYRKLVRHIPQPVKAAQIDSSGAQS